MQSITNYVWDLGGWNWFVIAAAMMLLETVIPGIHFMWFGVAAVIMGVTVLLMPMPIAYQLVLFALLSILTIQFARRYWAPNDMTTDEPALNERGVQYVGRTVTVVEPIENGRGKVMVGDTVWSAQGADRPEGATVKVTGVNGTVLIVN